MNWRRLGSIMGSPSEPAVPAYRRLSMPWKHPQVLGLDLNRSERAGTRSGCARSLGFGARVVTGHLYNPSVDGHTTAVTGAGTTHAWADIYLPGAGWIAYDPTNGTIGGGDLIRVAVTRDISQAVPIAGSFIGTPNDYLGMTVDVSLVSENRCARMASRS